MTVNDLLIMTQSLRFTCWVQGTHTLEFTGVLGMPIAYFHSYGKADIILQG